MAVSRCSITARSGPARGRSSSSKRASAGKWRRNRCGSWSASCRPSGSKSRTALATLLSVDPADLVFVRNATEAVNAVLRSLRFVPGDEILVTDHGYNACRNVAAYVAERSGARLAVAEVPLAVRGPEEIVDRVLAACTPRVRLALLDHVTSPTALVFPIQRLVHELKRRGVETLVDGAHAPGMLPLDLTAIGAAYYAGNGHKWLCGPKGVGFLHVRRDRQEGIEPAVISHGYNTRRSEQPRLHAAFDWTGTDDPTPALCLAASIRWLDGLGDGGLAGLMRRNHELAVAGRRLLCRIAAAGAALSRGDARRDGRDRASPAWRTAAGRQLRDPSASDPAFGGVWDRGADLLLAGPASSSLADLRPGLQQSPAVPPAWGSPGAIAVKNEAEPPRRRDAEKSFCYFRLCVSCASAVNL